MKTVNLNVVVSEDTHRKLLRLKRFFGYNQNEAVEESVRCMYEKHKGKMEALAG